MTHSRKDIIWAATFAIAAALFAGTAVWGCWALFTPGDYFANGSTMVLPSLLLSVLAGAIVGWRTRSKKVRALLAAACVLAVAYIILLPDGWWAHPPPLIH